ncbi:MAG: hypothetical protein KAI33_00985, partial [Elusimicrobiales bacterium]|nr:hypothetical protein [Elusimicrobiales bacterium]
FNNEKERMMDELEKRERIIDAGNLKIESLEDDLINYRENSSKMVMDQIVGQEKKFASQFADFDKKRAEFENSYNDKISNLKREYEVKIDKMDKIIQEKNEFISQKEDYFKQCKEEINSREAALSGKTDDFNKSIAEERITSAAREDVIDKKNREREIEQARKINELEKMKEELSRAIREHKGKSK